MSAPRPSNERRSEREALAAALERARHLLPAQAPIRSFVHHNTLHAFEDLPFDEAVVLAAERFGAEPYELESAFAAHLASGRIDTGDLDAVLREAAIDDAPVWSGGPSRRALYELRLQHPLELPQGAALAWHLTEGDALSRFHPAVSEAARARILASAARALGRHAVDAPAALAALYAALAPHAPAAVARAPGPRPRDRVLAERGVDVDELVHPVLVRSCAAFVDQGVAYWSMPARARGLFPAFRALYAAPGGPPDPWLRGLGAELAALEGQAPEEVALDALRRLGVGPADLEPVVEGTLLALRGWAGMIAQLEARPDRAPVWRPPARLVDLLALALLLEARAVQHVSSSRAAPAVAASARRSEAPELVYEAFLLAQLAGIGPHELAPERARALVALVAELDGITRRRLWHRAYERHHRDRVLDALLAHVERGVPALARPWAQVLCCIDDRAESLRRHLEELDPSIETFGYAGFFGVSMAYRGLGEASARPLCPVAVRPRHLVVEEPIEEAHARRVAARRRWAGRLRHGAAVGSSSLVRGGVLAATVGMLGAIPLVGRVLFPRLTERLVHHAARATFGEPATRLRFARADDDEAIQDGLFGGFTVAEMADIVGALLGATGMGAALAPLVVVVGHGSSSLNNPHESAYDCGATGGGRGGPNARAFAAMANHEGVRAELARRGAPIPEGTWFVGAEHDTCRDSIEWLDADLVPPTLEAALERLAAQLERALALDAHERCRRFASAPLEMTPARAHAHVEARSADLGEPRPECGHATNAVCIVAPRARTRGLFLDRRAFLVSYEPAQDPDGAHLGALLAAVGPVSAGINLEYYFSFVDPEVYGAGTKLPHNITGLVGVMNGHASDLRTGLPWQMVEIHEPVRLSMIVEADPQKLERVLAAHPDLARLAGNGWMHLIAWCPDEGRMWRFERDGFVSHERARRDVVEVARSPELYRGRREHLECARVEAALGVGAR